MGFINSYKLKNNTLTHEWVAGKTVWFYCYTQAISERFRDKGLITKRYINLSVSLLTYLLNIHSGHVYRHLPIVIFKNSVYDNIGNINQF